MMNFRISFVRFEVLLNKYYNWIIYNFIFMFSFTNVFLILYLISIKCD